MKVLKLIRKTETQKQSLLIILLIIVSLMGCNSKDDITTDISNAIFVSIPPQADILKKITGPESNIQTLVQPGQSPATYDPTPKQIAGLAQADICFCIGVPFEKSFREKAEAVFESVKLIDTYHNIKLRSMSSHSHDNHALHLDIGTDPHIWLSPLLMKKIASNMTDGLQIVYQDQSSFYADNLLILHNQLDSLHKHIKNILAPFEGDTIYVYHPSYGYFTDEYGLTMVALEPEGKEADPNYLAQLMTNLKSKNIAAIFVQPQFSDHLAKSIASQIDTKLVILDPLAENYFENMITIAEKIAEVLTVSDVGGE